MVRTIIEGLPSLDEDAATDDANNPVVFDTDSLAFLRRDLEGRSVATTRLASEIGSVVGRPKDARIKSFTYYPIHDADNDADSNATEIEWQLDLVDGKIGRKSRILVQAVDGMLAELSQIEPGDYIQCINDTNIGPKFDAAQAQQHVKTRLATDGYLSIATVNPEGDEVWMQATIIKPRPDMTLADLGMTVWVWGYVSVVGILHLDPRCQTPHCGLAIVSDPYLTVWFPHVVSFALNLSKRTQSFGTPS
eukprot:scaffold4743_cov171-Amphora_coffeaeformis.AAC.26